MTSSDKHNLNSYAYKFFVIITDNKTNINYSLEQRAVFDITLNTLFNHTALIEISKAFNFTDIEYMAIVSYN